MTTIPSLTPSTISKFAVIGMSIGLCFGLVSTVTPAQAAPVTAAASKRVCIPGDNLCLTIPSGWKVSMTRDKRHKNLVSTVITKGVVTVSLRTGVGATGSAGPSDKLVTTMKVTPTGITSRGLSRDAKTYPVVTAQYILRDSPGVYYVGAYYASSRNQPKIGNRYSSMAFLTGLIVGRKPTTSTFGSIRPVKVVGVKAARALQKSADFQAGAAILSSAKYDR